jgi:hypothetical protein
MFLFVILNSFSSIPFITVPIFLEGVKRMACDIINGEISSISSFFIRISFILSKSFLKNSPYIIMFG